MAQNHNSDPKEYEYQGKIVIAKNKEEANRKLGKPLKTYNLTKIKARHTLKIGRYANRTMPGGASL
jgi:hypothetical protein